MADVTKLDKLCRIYARFSSFDNLIRKVIGSAISLSIKFKFFEVEDAAPTKIKPNLEVGEPEEKEITKTFFSDIKVMNDMEWEEHIRGIFNEIMESHDLRLEMQLGHKVDKTEELIKKLMKIKGMEEKASQLAEEWYAKTDKSEINIYNKNVQLHSNAEFERIIFLLKRDFWINLNDKITSGNCIRKEMIMEWSRVYIKLEKSIKFKRVYDTWFYK